jgi:hypothetical protein
MTEVSHFDRVAEELERISSLSRLEARGTLRIALKDFGFDPRTVAPGQLKVVIEKCLPESLLGLGISEGEEIARQLAAGLSDAPNDGAKDSPEAIFARLGSS